jgi:hypothetical protein
MFIGRKKTLLIVAVAGICVKAVEFMVWNVSTFRFYNFVPGLDMPTLLRFGEWGTEGNGFFLTPHRALVAAWWALNGQSHFVPGVVAVQALFGILGAVLCADLALKFCRRDKTAAFFAGGLYLLYGPFFIYEFSVLQEAVALNLILLAFHAAVSARSRRGFVRSGVALGLCVVGRPTALLFVPLMIAFTAYRESVKRRRGRRETAKKTLLLLAGAAAVLCAVSAANRIFGGNWSPFFNAVPYSLEFNAGAPGELPSVSSSGIPYLDLAVKAACRAPQMFMPTEVPENLNYCFLCGRIMLLDILPGPGLLLPLALAGMMLMLSKLRRAPALLLLPIVSLVLPLCVREPIGRYRLTLIPYFILCAACWLHAARQKPAARKLPAALAGLTFSVALLLPSYRRDLLRSDDYMTHALALEYPNGGKPTQKSIDCLAEGWMKGNCRNDKLGIELYLRLKAAGDREAALRVLSQGIESSPGNDVYRALLARETFNPRPGSPEPPPKRPDVSAPDGAGASGTAPAPPAAPSRQ